MLLAGPGQHIVQNPPPAIVLTELVLLSDAQQVSFVLIAGDLVHKPSVDASVHSPLLWLRPGTQKPGTVLHRSWFSVLYVGFAVIPLAKAAPGLPSIP